MVLLPGLDQFKYLLRHHNLTVCPLWNHLEYMPFSHCLFLETLDIKLMCKYDIIHKTGSTQHITSLSPPTHTHSRLTDLCQGPPGWADTRKVKPIWILLKQETVSCSGISWAICRCAPRSRQITTPAPHHSDFYRPDTLPAAQPTASKHWRDITT